MANITARLPFDISLLNENGSRKISHRFDDLI